MEEVPRFCSYEWIKLPELKRIQNWVLKTLEIHSNGINIGSLCHKHYRRIDPR